jgi:predicted DNA-binding WGR domain protein
VAPAAVYDPQEHGWSIYEDYTAVLNRTDIAYGQKGSNKFYKIMLLQRREGEYKVRTEWGRVGAKGAANEQSFDNRIDAIVEFKQKFSDKTH